MKKQQRKIIIKKKMKEETRKKRKLEETPRLQTLRAEMKRWAQFEAAETTR